MKDKKHKYLEDLLDEYVQLKEEYTRLQLLIEKAQKKFDQLLPADKNITYKSADAEDLFKLHNQVKKYEDKKKEVNEDLYDLENSLKEFLLSLQGGKIAFDRRDDNDNSKSSYTFYIEGQLIKWSKQ